MGNNNFDMSKSPLSQTQIKDRLGMEDEDDFVGNSFAYQDINGQGLKGFGLIDHNFKSQTLQFQTNLGSEFINLFAPSEFALDKDSIDKLDGDDVSIEFSPEIVDHNFNF